VYVARPTKAPVTTAIKAKSKSNYETNNDNTEQRNSHITQVQKGN